MKNIGYIWILILSAACSGLCQTDHIRSEINKIIKYDTNIDINSNPGFLITIIDQGSTYHLPYGSNSNSPSDLATPDDIYELGSISKVFTALLTLVLQQEKILSLSDLINPYIPDQYQNPRLNHLTINDLLIHSSGLPKRPDMFGRKQRDPKNPYKHYYKEDLLKWYSEYVQSPTSKAKPFLYSHTNYALLELIIEKATNKTYEDILQQKIFKPLDMSKSYSDRKLENPNILATGYDRVGRLVPQWKCNSFAASEGLKSTATDLVKFVTAQFLINGESSLDKATTISQSKQVTATLNENISLAYGWNIYSRGDQEYDIYTHNGTTSGHMAFISYVRETQTAVIILSNSALGTQNLGMLVLRMINFNWKRKV